MTLSSSNVLYRIIQCRDTGEGEICNQVNQSTRIKEARGLQKQMFNSHLDMLYAHEMYDAWAEWDIDQENFVLIAYDYEMKVIYTYRVIIDDS